MKREYEVITHKDDGIFSTLVIKYFNESSSILCSMNLTIHEVTRELSISPKNISNIEITKQGYNRTITIKYSKFDLCSITLLEDPKNQILQLLNLLGYPKDKVISIALKESSWFVIISDHYDPDENLSKANHEIWLSRQISDALNFKVDVSIF